jgi:hypothetical protein
VPPERELGVEAHLVRAQALLLEPLGLGTARGGERDVREHRAAPDRQGRGSQLDRSLRVPGSGCGGGVFRELEKRPRVQDCAVEPERVAGAATYDRRTETVDHLP